MIKLLEGIRVLECAMLPTGDQTSRLLGDLGADVIKIERPGTGDYLRELGDRITDQNSVFHLYCNRNKRSVELNLRSDEGREIFFELLKTADIFVDGFAGDACDKLGIGYTAQRDDQAGHHLLPGQWFRDTRELQPDPGSRLHDGRRGRSVSVSGVRRHGRHRGRRPRGPVLLRSMSTGRCRPHCMRALTAAAALRYRDQTGQGCYIDAAGADAVLANQGLDAVMAWNSDRITDRRNPPPPVGLDPRRRPKYTYYQTKDDKIVLLAAIEHKFWDNFCRAVNREDLLDAQNKTFAVDFADGGKADLLDELIPMFRSRTEAEWMDIARMYDIPLCPANSKRDTLTDAHLAAREIVHHSEHPVAGPYTSPGWPAPVGGQPFDTRRPAPALGEHTEEVLSEIGFSREDVAELRSRAVV